MPKTKQKLQKKHKEFYSLYPSLSYIEYADSKQLDRNSTKIGYRSTLESLKNSGNRECRKQAMDQNTLFDTLEDPTSEFGKEYKLYWDLRDSEEKKTTSRRASQQLQQMH
ncbi:hypothetical protein BDB01DRAFT_837116 [Pilobolus umbonatus]|nr:hypothetical protein BDB01DRAFT_837116 [Pilobolus umbonatus]